MPTVSDNGNVIGNKEMYESIQKLNSASYSIRTHKQNSLDAFSENLKNATTQKTLQECINELKNGLSSNNTHELFKNRDGSHWKRQVPESAALAIIATAYKTFGNRLLAGNGQLDKDLLEMGLQTLFGKDMISKSREILIDVHLDEDKKIRSNHYCIDVGDVGCFYDFTSIVNVTNVNQGYFHSKKICEVLSLFGDLDNTPSIIVECTGKNYQKKITAESPQEIHEELQNMCNSMQADTEMYNNKTNLPGNIEHNVSLKFVGNSRPSISNKHQASIVGADILSLPVNVWQAQFRVKINNVPEKISTIVLCAVQDHLHAAKQVLNSVLKGKPQNNKPKTIVVDLRFLTELNQKGITGSEKTLFERHKELMKQASNEASESVEYVTLHCEAHSHKAAILPRLAFASAMVTGIGAVMMYARSTGPLFSKGLSSPDDIKNIEERMTTLFNNMDKASKEKYSAVFRKWSELVGQLHHERNTVPFATLTNILATAINQNNDGDTNMLVVMGCKSAKDRTTSVILGNSLLQTLIEKRLAEHVTIENLFDKDGYFSCDSLTTEELVMLKDLFDIRMLHIANKFNVGLEGNINTAVLKDSFFKNVDFIHESNSYTVGMGS